jgi:hypothetical protein
VRAPAKTVYDNGPIVTFNITAMPPATLFIDDKRVGQTPIKGYKLIGAGDYAIRLERPDHDPVRETIRVTEERTVRRYYALRRTQR